jgi:hypothetical protein
MQMDIKNQTVDFDALRCDFPILQETNRGKAMIYLCAKTTSSD